MIPNTQTNLLRRTLAVLSAATALLLASGTASALNVILSNGSSCAYSGMTVDPAGNVNVACQGATTNDPGTFVLSVATSLNVSTSTTATVSRTGGTTGAVNIGYTVSGAGCTGASGTLTFPDTSATAQSFTVTAGATGGTACTVALGNPSAGALGSPSTANITVNATPPPTNNTSCPAGFTPPADLQTATFQGVGQWWPQMQKSGQIVSIALPAVSTYSKQVAFGENVQAYTPSPVTLEVTISKCPGFIDTDVTNPTNPHPNGNFCNLKSTNGTTNSVTWFGKAFSILNSATVANQYGYCWAPESEGQWYVNARWKYTSCLYGASICGFSIQQNLGPY